MSLLQSDSQGMCEVVEAPIQKVSLGDEEGNVPRLPWHSGVLHGWDKLEGFL